MYMYILVTDIYLSPPWKSGCIFVSTALALASVPKYCLRFAVAHHFFHYWSPSIWSKVFYKAGP